MPDLLLELFSEEIPARMQRRAADDLKKRVTDALVERGFLYDGAKAFATPRRLALHVAGLPPRGEAVREERRGPRVGAPEAAVQGFLKSAGLASLDDAKTVTDPKKGEFYLAVIERPGRETLDVLAEILPAIIKSFPWPKSMRWGPASAKPGSLRWVRPLHSIVATFGPETETPETVPFSVEDIAAGTTTYGHRFLAPGPIEVRRFDDYVPALERAKVVLDADRRKDIILHDAKDLAFARGLDLVEDEGLLEEVAGLVEWPVVLMGSFDEAFLDIPPEAIRATIRANQKCFVLRKSGSESLAPAFILVSNLEASDGGGAITAGNERVVRARLADAKFFWETDKAVPLESRLPKLDAIVFHEKLGTQGERVKRIAALARELAPLVGADPALAERAATLAKADLVTEMVGEFPELQGLMGRYYAGLQGEHESVCTAIEEHYKPLGPSDRVPSDPVAVAVALADKLDTLVGFWAIDEKPTGSKDPYALRRAALGAIRLLLDNSIQLSFTNVLTALFGWSLARNSQSLLVALNQESWRSVGPVARRIIYKTPHQIRFLAPDKTSRFWLDFLIDELEDAKLNLADESVAPKPFNLPQFLEEAPFRLGLELVYEEGQPKDWPAENAEKAVYFLQRMGYRLKSLSDFAGLVSWDFKLNIDWFETDLRVIERRGDISFSEIKRFVDGETQALLVFLADRLKVYLRDQGARHDLIDAVFALPGQDDLLMVARRVEALGQFLDTDDGRNLLAGYKRAANILTIEEKKHGRAYDSDPDEVLIAASGQPEEQALAEALRTARGEASAAIAAEDFSGAMRALSRLRAPVDAFFEKVTVNADDPALRENRLALLNALRAATREVGDFSRIEG